MCGRVIVPVVDETRTQMTINPPGSRRLWHQSQQRLVGSLYDRAFHSFFFLRARANSFSTAKLTHAPTDEQVGDIQITTSREAQSPCNGLRVTAR